MDSAPRAAAQEPARSTTSGNGRRGVIDLARVAVDDVIRLVQQEIQLAKVEVKELISTNVKAAIMLAATGLCGLLVILMLLVALVEWIPNHTLAALVIALVFAILGGILFFVGKGMLKIGPPQKTMESLKEDAEWARHRLTRNGK